MKTVQEMKTVLGVSFTPDEFRAVEAMLSDVIEVYYEDARDMPEDTTAYRNYQTADSLYEALSKAREAVCNERWETSGKL